MSQTLSWSLTLYNYVKTETIEVTTPQQQLNGTQFLGQHAVSHFSFIKSWVQCLDSRLRITYAAQMRYCLQKTFKITSLEYLELSSMLIRRLYCKMGNFLLQRHICRIERWSQIASKSVWKSWVIQHAHEKFFNCKKVKYIQREYGTIALKSPPNVFCKFLLG